MKWFWVTVGLVVLATATMVTVVGLAGTVWSRRSMIIRGEILAGSEDPLPVAGGTVPSPVAAYLARSIPVHAGEIIGARFEQEGQFRTGEGPEGWRPFTASHSVRLYPPAFLWDARIAMAPFLTVRVRDGYRDGQGSMTAKIGGLIPVANAPPTPELAKAALERYLAEAPWIPIRLLPCNGLEWSPVDDTTVVATLTDGGPSVSGTMTFGEDGDIVGVFVAEWGREVDGAFVPTPWVGRFWDHGLVQGGFRIPRQGEVAWVIDGDTVPYWRGRVTSVSVWAKEWRRRLAGVASGPSFCVFAPP